MEWALTWTNTVMGRILQGPNAAGIDWDRVYAHRPLLTMDEAMGRKMWLYRDFVQYPDHDPYWKDIHFGPETLEQIDLRFCTWPVGLTVINPPVCTTGGV